jgi:hypothetical protein
MASGEAEKGKLKSLGMSCTAADCDSGLHCFRRSKKKAQTSQSGVCRYCNADLVNWERVYKRDLGDVSYTFEALKHEFIRHQFWHEEIDVKAVNYARRKGRIGMQEAVEKRIRKYVSPAENAYDGRQTPWEGNAMFYAQHATATCCRRCLEEWHNIERGRELTDDEIAYCASLVMLYVNERLPFLTEEGEKVPPLRRSSLSVHNIKEK